jgi:hypothetical protein
MSEAPQFPKFDSFVSSLRQTNLPGTKNRKFMQKVYRLAEQARHYEAEGEAAVKDAARPHRQVIRKCVLTRRALRRVEKELDVAKKRAAEIYPHPFYWQILFEPAEESVADVTHKLEQIQQQAADSVHGRFLAKKETHKYEVLLPDYDYPSRRLGSKPVETWFCNRLNDLLTLKFRGKEALTPRDRYRLIQSVFRTSFNVHKELKTIEVALRRSRRVK